MPATSPSVAASRRANRRYSDLRGTPSSNTTSEATTSVPPRWLMSTHSMRSGAVSSPRYSCSSDNAADRAVRSPARRSLCWANASSALRATVSASCRLSPRCGTRNRTREPRSRDSHCSIASASAGSAGTSTSRGTGEASVGASAARSICSA